MIFRIGDKVKLADVLPRDTKLFEYGFERGKIYTVKEVRHVVFITFEEFPDNVMGGGTGINSKRFVHAKINDRKSKLDSIKNL